MNQKLEILKKKMEKAICATCGKENPVNYKYCFGCGYEMPKPDVNSLDVTETVVRKKPKRNNQLLSRIVFAVAFITCFFAAQYFFFGSASVDKNLMKVASQINESCPFMVDSETRLDNAVVLPKKVFQYYYTLVNVDKNEVDPSEMKKGVEPRIANMVKTNPDMKAMRDLDVTFKYSYKDKNGSFLFDITISPTQYQ